MSVMVLVASAKGLSEYRICILGFFFFFLVGIRAEWRQRQKRKKKKLAANNILASWIDLRSFFKNCLSEIPVGLEP